jgi:hypothetical protein
MYCLPSNVLGSRGYSRRDVGGPMQDLLHAFDRKNVKRCERLGCRFVDSFRNKIRSIKTANISRPIGQSADIPLDGRNDLSTVADVKNIIKSWAANC